MRDPLCAFISRSAMLAAVCGSSPVTAATIGAMAVPEMMRRGYDKSLALGTASENDRTEGDAKLREPTGHGGLLRGSS